MFADTTSWWVTRRSAGSANCGNRTSTETGLEISGRGGGVAEGDVDELCAELISPTLWSSHRACRGREVLKLSDGRGREERVEC